MIQQRLIKEKYQLKYTDVHTKGKKDFDNVSRSHKCRGY